MSRSTRSLITLLMQTLDKCQRDNTPMLAAGLSFYTMLSLAPALWIVLAAAGAFIGRESAYAVALSWTERNMGPNAAAYLAGIVQQVNESSRLATIGGAVAVFFAATAAFGALQDSLDRIWHQPGTADGGMLATLKGLARTFLTRRALAFLMMLLLGVLLLASLAVGTAVAFLAGHLPAGLPAPRLLLDVADFLVSFVLLTLVFGVLYHMLHRKAFPKKGLWTGAALTAALFALGETLLSSYLGSVGVRSAYGAAGSLVLLLLWIYYSAQILLFGAVFTDVYSRQPSGGR